MRPLTPKELQELKKALDVIAEGAIASMAIEGEPLPEGYQPPETELSPKDQYLMAKQLGIIDD